jgi:phosphotransferase system HPr (HPr) family protein
MPASCDPLPATSEPVLAAEPGGPVLAVEPGGPVLAVEPGGPEQRTVVLPKHLHARPAGQVAQAAARNPATTIELAAGTRHANARSVLAVMALGAVSGSEVQVRVSGADAATVLTEIVDILLAPEE